MAPSFRDLVALQRTADKAHDRVQQLTDEHCRRAMKQWTQEQRTAWHTAWKAWVDSVRELQETVTIFASEHRREIHQVNAEVKKKARSPKPTAGKRAQPATHPEHRL